MLAVALCVLWVRSYWRCDDVSLGIAGGPGYKVISLRGEISASRYPSREGAVSVGWRHATVAPDGLSQLSSYRQSQLFGFAVAFPYFIVVPQWFLLFASTVLVVAPWSWRIQWRFSLRTMLIATTLIAVVLGAVAWVNLSRNALSPVPAPEEPRASALRLMHPI